MQVEAPAVSRNPAGPALRLRQPRARPSGHPRPRTCPSAPAPHPRLGDRQQQHPYACPVRAAPVLSRGYLGLSRRISAADAAIPEAPWPRRQDQLPEVQPMAAAAADGKPEGSNHAEAAPLRSCDPGGAKGRPRRPPRHSRRSELRLYIY